MKWLKEFILRWIIYYRTIDKLLELNKRYDSFIHPFKNLRSLYFISSNTKKLIEILPSNDVYFWWDFDMIFKSKLSTSNFNLLKVRSSFDLLAAISDGSF